MGADLIPSIDPLAPEKSTKYREHIFDSHGCIFVGRGHFDACTFNRDDHSWRPRAHEIRQVFPMFVGDGHAALHTTSNLREDQTLALSPYLDIDLLSSWH
jgi:hypothetical protein